MERQKIIAFLTDLRSIILKSLGAVVILGIISFIYAKDIIKLLLKTANLQVYYLNLPEVFFTTVELALYGGVFLAWPVIIYLTWHQLKGTIGIKPVYGYLFILFAIVLFYGGSLFCYRFVLPSGIKFLLSYEGGAIRATISVERFVLFCSTMIFAFGVTFECFSTEEVSSVIDLFCHRGSDFFSVMRAVRSGQRYQSSALFCFAVP